MSGLSACVCCSKCVVFPPAQAHTCLLPQQRGAGREGGGRLRSKVGNRFERRGEDRKNMGVRTGKSQTSQLCLDRIYFHFFFIWI